jgi:MFS transporter, SP family, arabinose:H+ symporter
VRRALIIVCVFFIFQQITGINVPFYYGPTLLSSFFQSGHNAVSAAVAGVEVTAILGAVNVVATYFAFRWIDKLGRRPLAMFGYAGMTVFILLAAAGVAFLTDLPKTVVVMVGFSFFITSFAIGVGGTGWLIQGEVCASRSFACSRSDSSTGSCPRPRDCPWSRQSTSSSTRQRPARRAGPPRRDSR